MDNQILAERLKVILATAHAFALKSQNYHWNVTGPHFVEYHEFFQTIYEQIHLDVDTYAEQIRILGMFAPGSLTRFSEMSRVKCELNIPKTDAMIVKLSSDNQIMLELLKSCHSVSSTANNPGLTSILEERIQYHEKLGWMLASMAIK